MNGIWKDLDSLRILEFFGGNIAKEGKYLLNPKTHHPAYDKCQSLDGVISKTSENTVTRLTTYRRNGCLSFFSPMS